MKILHLIKDEKFPDSAYEFFEAVAPGQNTFMLDGKVAPIMHLKKIIPIRVSKYAFWNPKFIRTLEQYDAIILHSLSAFSLEVLARLSDRVPVVWIGMGYDYYDFLTTSPSDLLKPETLALNSPATKRLQLMPKKLVKNIVRRVLQPNVKYKRKLVQKIDLFAPVLQSEYLLVKNAIGTEPFPDYIRWNYGKIVDLIDGKLGERGIVGKNILIGNSARPTNNHVDIFRILAEAGIPADSKVIVPLSYGNSVYREKVIAEGQRLLGDKFEPVTEFMDLDKYIELLSTCSSVIMNHLRQQGVGNLFITLFLGAKVYLDTSNPVYAEFTDMGLSVKPVDSLFEESLELNQPLEASIAMSQKDIIREIKGRAAFERYTQNLIAEVARINKEYVL